MNTFIFRPVAGLPRRKKIKQKLTSIKMYQYRGLILMIIWCITNFILYAIIINITSTKGFFLGQAEKKTAQEEFRYNIIRFTLVSQQREVRQKIYGGNSTLKITMQIPELQ